MNVDEKTVSKVGPGGYKCACCGPSPKQRPKWRRMVRHRLKVLHRNLVRSVTRGDIYE